MRFSCPQKKSKAINPHTCTPNPELLVQDLRELIKCDNPLLGELAIEILQQAVQIEQRLKRIESATRPEEKTL